MDVYSGSLSPDDVIEEIMKFLEANNLVKKNLFFDWAGAESKRLQDNFIIRRLSMGIKIF